ncbi:hypothetical protein ABE28_004045 [Peribacillus muralis]|uniref:DUF3147 family protein n=1 Tax=Peribacillus muralis TaxID=264697 RepID=A0A1B3XJW5_9BACI|nr:DUF3147 family protein [Peribacillus muralis]AOH53513.1 hypothetical protein ABE28_004045 [Peribacillus muralis]
MFTLVKIIASAIIIGVITEISRRYPHYGGMLAALPIISVISILWLYIQGEQLETLSKFALSVVWGIPATVVMLVIIWLALQHSLHLFFSLGLGLAGWLLFLFAQNLLIKHVIG